MTKGRHPNGEVITFFVTGQEKPTRNAGVERGFFACGKFRPRATPRALGFAFAFGFGRTTTSTCSCGIGTAATVPFERELFCSTAPAGSIAIVGAAREATMIRTSGCARRDRDIFIFWKGLEGRRSGG